jgi:hypothetical protein
LITIGVELFIPGTWRGRTYWSVTPAGELTTKKRSALKQTQDEKKIGAKKFSKPSTACLKICVHKLLAHGGEGAVL